MNEPFRYNSAFLPEYLSTVLISLFITWAYFLGAESRLPKAGNPHVKVAATLYSSLAGLLIILTVIHRYRHCPIRLSRVGIGRRFLGVRAFSAAWAEVADVWEQWGSFFGRRCRVLNVILYGRAPLFIHDFIYGYERLKEALQRARGQPIKNKDLLPEDIARFTAASKHREEVFGAPIRMQDLPSAHVRVVGLIPVFLVDLVTTVFFTEVVFRSRAGNYSPLVVYSNVAGLLVAALVARWLYYYVFSSTMLHLHMGLRAVRRRVGWRWRPPGTAGTEPREARGSGR